MRFHCEPNVNCGIFRNINISSLSSYCYKKGVYVQLDIIIIAAVAIICAYVGRFFKISLPLVMLLTGIGLQLGGVANVPELILFLLGTFCLVFAALDHSVQHPPRLVAASLYLLLTRIGFLFVTVPLIFLFLGYPVAIAVLLSLISIAIVPSTTSDILLRDTTITSGILSVVLPVALLAGAEAAADIIGSMIGIVAAVGTGIVVGLLFFRIIRYGVAWERWLLFLAGMITYFIGSYFSSAAGILGVVTLAILSSKIHVPYKFVHTPQISRTVTTITYLLLGLLTPISITGLLLGIILAVLTIFSIYASYRTIRMTDKQRIRNSINSTPSLPGAATVLALITYLPSIGVVLAPATIAFGIMFLSHTIVESSRKK